jgi:hypothetical protein
MKRIIPIVVGVWGPAQRVRASRRNRHRLARRAAQQRERRRSSSGNRLYPRDAEKGTNRLVCMDRSGHGQQPFMIECTSIANLTGCPAWFEADRQGQETGAARYRRGERHRVSRVWVVPHVMGPDQERTRNHDDRRRARRLVMGCPTTKQVAWIIMRARRPPPMTPGEWPRRDERRVRFWQVAKAQPK